MTLQKIEAHSPEAQSADLIADNIAKLRAMFPELLTESGTRATVNVDVLKQLVGDATAYDGDEKYGLNWHGKRKARQIALTPSTGTLRPCPEESVDWDSAKNLMIEGDNLEVLKLLQKSYAGKVKLIYIDPPYNTGKDFVYPDNFQDNIRNYLELTGQTEGGAKITTNTDASGRFHTDWLNMMYPRLRLARNLLSDDGVIFVSIDDSESANLKFLLSEIFGEENYIDTIAVEMSTTSGPKTVNAQQGTIVKNVEFVHIFRKSAAFDLGPHTPLLDGIENYDIHYSVWLNDDGTLGSLADALLSNRAVADDIQKYGFLDRGRFSVNNLSKLLLLSEAAKSFVEANLNRIARVDRPPVSAAGRSTIVGQWEAFEVDHRTYFLTTLSNGTLQALMPLALNYRESDDYKPRFGRTVIRGDLWKGFHQDMGNVAKEGDVAYSNGKKPVRLIKQLIKWANIATDGIVLDFFAGSGTTAHAVMQLSAENNKNLRYVMVQLPEPLDPNNSEQKVSSDLCDKLNKPRNIAEITKERLRRASAEVKTDNPLFFTGDNGFRVFKLDTSNIRAWNPNAADLKASLFDHLDHLEAGRSSDDILYEILIKLGLDLCVPIETREIAGKQVNSVGAGVLMACLDESIKASEAEALALGMLAWREEQGTVGDTTAVFRDSAFENDIAKSNLAAILNQHGIKQVRSL
ncbi:site-specific DNA-methyltransferase [Methyloversatilis discipulorum]|uniref:site-specific DNA-methyltransferase n=1 Tax=Methyloversatilis discipulorum TaxID=1119528 RepID=UPI0004A499A5|nr:site-specific DNA-methyltransferase [Methyloversatilis discipulorum]